MQAKASQYKKGLLATLVIRGEESTGLKDDNKGNDGEKERKDI